MASEWIATEWVRQEDLDPDSTRSVLIHLTRSPHYAGNRFAVRDGHECLNRQGEWEYEPMPSDRDDEFLARCRFLSFEDARKAAEAAIAEED